MNPVGKALWYIESHFSAAELSLEEIADMGGVSRYHMTRAFGAATGHSIMRYVRGRRLTEAARALASGAPDILAVAIEAGYGSHEAFTRAFRDQFGATPEQVRAQRRIDNLNLVEPIKMDETPNSNLAPPRFVDGKLLLIAGIGERYDCDIAPAFPHNGNVFCRISAACPARSARSPMACVATPMSQVTSTTSPESRSPTSLSCRGNGIACASRLNATQCSRIRATFPPSVAPGIQSGMSGCR